MQVDGIEAGGVLVVAAKIGGEAIVDRGKGSDDRSGHAEVRVVGVHVGKLRGGVAVDPLHLAHAAGLVGRGVVGDEIEVNAGVVGGNDEVLGVGEVVDGAGRGAGDGDPQIGERGGRVEAGKGG